MENKNVSIYEVVFKTLRVLASFGLYTVLISSGVNLVGQVSEPSVLTWGKFWWVIVILVCLGIAGHTIIDFFGNYIKSQIDD